MSPTGDREDRPLCTGKLVLDRPLVFIKVETTGIKIEHARIIEIAMLKVFPDGAEDSFRSLVHPEMTIPYEASGVNGITDEMVKDAPVFRDLAPRIATFIRGCDLAGYNIRRFSLPIIAEAFLRANYPIDLRSPRVVDVQVIFHKREERNLIGAYRFYCGKEMSEAHSAEADTRASFEVLKGQLRRYADLPDSVEDLHRYSSRLKAIDLQGRLIYDERGGVVLNFGKYRGQLVEEILKTHPDYIEWMMHSDFAGDTKRALRQAIIKAETKESELIQRIEEQRKCR